MIIDTHSHLSFKAYDADREDVLKRIQQAEMICIDVGTKFETSKNAIDLAIQNENIFAAIGLHPIHIKTDLIKFHTDEDEGNFAPLGEIFDAKKYQELAENKNNKVVAIGEIGLDYYYKPKTKSRLEEFKNLQKKVFIEQLDLAQDLDLPVIIHCRMAFDDLFEILKDRRLRGVVHCFTGNLEQAKKFVKMGFYLGINGIIDKMDLNEVIKNISLNKILVETDCPYLTPIAEGKEKRNEPIFVKHVIQKIADLRNISFEEVASQTTQNAKALFHM